MENREEIMKKAKEFREKFEKTGELPAHLAKLVNNNSYFEDFEVPGFTV
jgi:hypothetical protein